MPSYNIGRVPLFLIVMVGSLFPLARAAAADELSGVVASSYEISDQSAPEAEAEVRFKTRRVAGVRAVAKLEARYFREDVALEDAFIDYRVSKQLRFQLGLSKKRVGLEYEQSRRERLTPRRSTYYQKLEELGIVGRQLNLRVLMEPTDGSFVDVTAGTDASRNANALLRVAREHDVFGFGLWGLLERRRIDKDYLMVWAYAASIWHLSERYRAVFEFISGVDAFETELARKFGTERRVRFFGPKVELAVNIPLGGGVALQPLLQSSFIVHDASRSGHNTLQLLGGFNIHFRGAVLAATVEYVGETERLPPHERTAPWPNLYVQARYHF